jgi:hypothetical protein
MAGMEQESDMSEVTPIVPKLGPTAEPLPIPLTVTHVLEHLFCPRFTYFEYVLAVPERQERRYIVQKGRESHEERKRINPNYLRKKLGVVQRRFDVPLASDLLGVRGSVDEVLGTISRASDSLVYGPDSLPGKDDAG